MVGGLRKLIGLAIGSEFTSVVCTAKNEYYVDQVDGYRNYVEAQTMISFRDAYKGKIAKVVNRD